MRSVLTAFLKWLVGSFIISFIVLFVLTSAYKILYYTVLRPGL